MRRGFYPGSFDPFTNGHLYVVKQAARLFDEVIVGVGQNVAKTRRVPLKSLVKAVETVLQRENLHNVRVLSYNNLTFEMARRVKADFLVRGVRNGADYDFEENLALVNYKLGQIETLYLRAGETAHVSSSMVCELARYGADIRAFVPPEVAALLSGS